MKKDKKKEMEEMQDFNLNENCECEHSCNCDESCHCQDGKECTCDAECHCEAECSCGEECNCDETHDCGCHGHGKHHNEEAQECRCHHHHADEAGQYLAMAQRLQADFENYRRRVSDQLLRERQEGTKNAVEVFLPCLDTFKEAKKSISDEGVLAGINMIENKILEALKTLKVEKIEALGAQFDPHLHNVIAAYADETKEDGIVLDEYQAGWTMDGKVIRYSKVVVNKRQ